jgi:uncharacterized membrane protein
LRVAAQKAFACACPQNPGAMSSAPPPDAAASPFPPVATIGASAPFGWLAAGARDLARAPGPSLFYGACFAAMGWAVYLVFRHAYEYAYGLTAGFLLLGPFLATGLYDISRRLERGERVRLADTLAAWRANRGAFSLFAVVLIVLMLLWSRASLITFALHFSGEGIPRVDRFLEHVVSVEHVDFLATWFAVGGLFALIVFAVSVVSVPLMLDRGTDTIVAALTSVRAFFANPGPLLLWAVLIALTIGAGFATLMIGLVFAAPVVGHATWHAYRALIR